MSEEFFYYAGVLVDKDVKLETLEDINREIEEAHKAIDLQRTQIKSYETGHYDPVLKKYGDKFEEMKKLHLKTTKETLRKYERILESLLTLRRRRFGERRN